ncbi:LOW QUALITY PROTEIN: Hypothetical protein PHPALM_37146 [Phytophthora palmivora]|uniref:Uncharacterized protein n=1 Tax=Phytophthora palmivora TaxID=4796 RepID=A0A2P4WY77_9STRA|nr:LOW QUALITY PROTEIN: Hypothetical protein PHPALM_37146 [Phytophthora palmivora]
MSIASLAPANTKKIAIESFTKFLAAEDLTLDAAHQLIDTDNTAEALRIMLDRYAYSLARSTDKIDLHIHKCGEVVLRICKIAGVLLHTAPELPTTGGGTPIFREAT